MSAALTLSLDNPNTTSISSDIDNNNNNNNNNNNTSSTNNNSNTEEAPVLREWSYPVRRPMSRSESTTTAGTSHENTANETQNSLASQVEGQEVEPMTPPVAPATILPPPWLDHNYNELPFSPRVPVANVVSSVSNFVREQFSAYTPNSLQDPNAHSLRSDIADVSTTIRSILSDDIPNSTRVHHFDALRDDDTATAAAAAATHPTTQMDQEQYIMVGENLVAILAQPQHEEEGAHHRRKHKKKGPIKKIGKWLKKQASKLVQTDDLDGDGSDHNKKKDKRRKKKRRNDTRQLLQQEIDSFHHSSHLLSDDDTATSHPTITSRRPPTNTLRREASLLPEPAGAVMPMSHCDSGGSAVSADFIGNADQVEALQSADFIGNADELITAGVLTNVAPADIAIIEPDAKYDSSIEKVKQDDIVIDSMLQQARHESSESDDPLEPLVEPPRKPHAKDDEDSKPLSEAKRKDQNVWNDMLKVIVLGTKIPEKSAFCRSLAGKKPRRQKDLLCVDVHNYAPDLKFSIWDINSVNAGEHPATQALFFSSGTLYIVLWDLAQWNMNTFPARRARTFTVEDGNDSEDDELNDFQQEELKRSSRRALEIDIRDRVLAWMDSIVTPGSAIMPVVIVPLGMDEDDIRNRCTILQDMMMRHPAFEGDGAPNLVLGKNCILRVNMETGEGFPELQDVLHSIGNENVFRHLGTHTPPHVVTVLEAVRQLKSHKVLLLDHLMSEMNMTMNVAMPVEQVKDALYYLSNIGEVLYYGNSTDEILSKYVILSRKWLVSALSCILRPDLRRELGETRRFMNLQSIYSGEGAFVESDIVQTLLYGTHSICPILSAKDSAMLWKSMSFMRDAADRSAQLSEASDATTMYDFLERLLVYSGIFLPLAVSGEPTYFIPSLLDTAEPTSVWTYKTSESWNTTLCHSWLLRESAPANTMEIVTTALLHDLYEYSHTFRGQPSSAAYSAKMAPFGMAHEKVVDDPLQAPESESIGRIRIHQVMCWESSVLVKIGTAFAEPGQAHLTESFSEIYVALVDEQSNHCVATKVMSSGMKRVIVCGKGQVGHHGQKLWKGGYALVLDSIKMALSDRTGIDRQVVCPECLAHSHPRVACTWSWDSVRSAVSTGNGGVRCNKGHLVDCHLLCGTCTSTEPKSAPPPPPSEISTPKPPTKVSTLLPSVVLVAVWDADSGSICCAGSGFIADKKHGLIVTAGHVLFDMCNKNSFGAPYLGLKNASVLIGVIPDGGHTAVFRYFATIVAHDINNMDACVLKIKSRLNWDVNGQDCSNVGHVPVDDVLSEGLMSLKSTRHPELEESVRILGFNQGGEGRLEKGKHVNRSVDFAKGYVCKFFQKEINDDSSESSQSTAFNPREEIVVMCPTIAGHSGGPCVNDEGRVIGILSRADPVDRQRCYLVPTAELKTLVHQAKNSTHYPVK